MKLRIFIFCSFWYLGCLFNQQKHSVTDFESKAMVFLKNQILRMVIFGGGAQLGIKLQFTGRTLSRLAPHHTFAIRIGRAAPKLIPGISSGFGRAKHHRIFAFQARGNGIRSFPFLALFQTLLRKQFTVVTFRNELLRQCCDLMSELVVGLVYQAIERISLKE